MLKKIILTTAVYCLAFFSIHANSEFSFNEIESYSKCDSSTQGPQGPQGPVGNQGPQGPQGPQGGFPSAVFGYFYNPAIQAGILPGGGAGSIVNLPLLDPNQEGGFTTSANFGATVPVDGTYEINFRLLSSIAVSAALFRNNSLLPTTAFGNNSVTNAVNGHAIISLLAGDVITLRNINTVGTVATILPTTAATSPPIPASLTLVKLSD